MGVLIGRPALIAIFVAVAGVVFALGRLEFQFLGDGMIWVNALKEGTSFHHFEPLAAFLTRRLALALAPEQPERLAGALSIVSGTIYVAVTWFLCRSLWSETWARGLAWLLLVLNPLLLVFFGYVESYPLLLALQVLFVLVLDQSVRRQWPLVVPGLVLGLATATHIMALAWLPALVVAARGGRGKAVLQPALACAVTLLVAAGTAALVGGSPQRILKDVFEKPGLGGQGFGWMFSLRHLLDLVNQITLLLAPAGVLFAGALARGVPGAEGKSSLPWRVLVALLPGPLLLACLVEPRIGGARDWDLFLPLVLPVVLLAVHTLQRSSAPGRSASAPRLAVGQALGLAAVATASWLAVGLDPSRTARRLEVLQRSDGTFSNFARGYANETLGIYYRDISPAAAREAWVRAVQANPSNPRYLNNRGVEELRRRDVPAACTAFRRAKDLGMEDYVVFFNVANCERREGNLETAEKSYDFVIAKWPGRWEALGARGFVRVLLGRPDLALADLQAAVRLAPGEADIHYSLGMAQRALGRNDEARAAWQRAVQLDPAHARARKSLAELGGVAP